VELVLSGIASFAIATAAGEEFGIATYAKASVAGEGESILSMKSSILLILKSIREIFS